MPLPTLSPEDIKRVQPKLEQCVALLKEEAIEAIRIAKEDRSTKDGYGKIMSLCSSFPVTMKCPFLRAMMNEGYPHDTVASLVSIFGIESAWQRFNFILDANNVFQQEKA